jgi:hypothetical protein
LDSGSDENDGSPNHHKIDRPFWLEKYGWKLKRVELNKNDILKVDCVFEGETEFPKSYYDPEKEEKADA